jgi:hypothetical protein
MNVKIKTSALVWLKNLNKFISIQFGEDNMTKEDWDDGYVGYVSYTEHYFDLNYNEFVTGDGGDLLYKNEDGYFDVTDAIPDVIDFMIVDDNEVAFEDAIKDIEIIDCMEEEFPLTKELAITLHRRVWNWIYSKSSNNKRIVNQTEYFDSHKIHGDYRPRHSCYACQYAYEQQYAENMRYPICQYCPLDWGTQPDGSLNNCVGVGSEYSLLTKYDKNGDWRNYSLTAKRIAELPMKESEDKEGDNNG